MPRPVSPRASGASMRPMAIAAFTAAALTTVISMWAADRVAFAGTNRIEIQAATVVGPMSGDVMSPAVRMDPPEPAAIMTVDVAPAPITVPDAPAPVANVSACRTDLVGPVMTMTIPDISYSCPVYAGGQKMLDAGAATLITDDAIRSVLADHPGGPGVFWIAGHRTSHGGAFAAVPNLADGALITISDGTRTATYRVVGRLYASIDNDRVIDATGKATGAATLDSIIRPDHGGNGAARLLLQTCDGSNHRWMIYADLVAS